MNIHDGQLYGLGSSPGYDPSIFAKPRVPPAVYKQLTDEDLGAPLFDRATNGFYPAGSTFKPITALAALDSGEIDLNEIINDTGDFALGDGQVLHNAGDAVHGADRPAPGAQGELGRLLLHARRPHQRPQVR